MKTYDNFRNLLIKLRIGQPTNYDEFMALVHESLSRDGFGGSYSLSMQKPFMDMEIAEFVRAIYSFPGEYRWQERADGKERKLTPWTGGFLRRRAPDIMLVVEAVLPTEAEQIQINFQEFNAGRAATRARVVHAPDSELNDRRIWFTKRVGRTPIYTQQRARIDLGSGMNQLVLE